MEGLAAAYRDRSPLKVRKQGAGLEQTGAVGGPLVRKVCIPDDTRSVFR